MPEVTISIGGREFDVVCQDGEQQFLEAAATMLDHEARVLAQHAGRMPESRMLLMAGLMLADKTGGLEDSVRVLKDKLAAQEAMNEELKTKLGEAAIANSAPVEANGSDTAMLEELVTRAETLADRIQGGDLD
ncbi:MAG: cell division protein ZapA [Mangrovicoccus sp.]